MNDAKIYKSQDNLMIVLSYTTSPGTIASGRIKYRNPNGNIGYWDATVDTSAKTFTKIFALGETLGMAGRWTFWAYATLSDGRVNPGSPVTVQVYTEGY